MLAILIQLFAAAAALAAAPTTAQSVTEQAGKAAMVLGRAAGVAAEPEALRLAALAAKARPAWSA